MIPTIEYVERKFNEFNALCFGGKLPLLPFKLSDARTFLGMVQFYREKNADGTWRYFNFVFRVSTKIDMPQEIVDDTILHEMIHYHILYNQLQDTAPHGELFLEMMRDINHRFNRNISVTHKVTNEEHDRDKEVRQHLLCAMRFRNGQWGIIIATRSKIFQLWDEVPNIPDIAEWKWYSTTDPYFNRFQRATSLKVYRVPFDELEEHLTGASELERRGTSIFVKKQK